MGVATSLITSLIREVQKRGGTDEDIHRLVTPEGGETLENIANLVVGLAEPEANIIPATFKLQVDYDQTVEEMIAAGKYDLVDSEITPEHFPNIRIGRREVEFHLFHFDRVISTVNAIKKLEKLGFRSAELPELLAFGAKYPE